MESDQYHIMIVPGIAVGIVTNLVLIGYSSFFLFAVADSSILLNRESPAYEYSSMKWMLVNQLLVLQFHNIKKCSLIYTAIAASIE